MYALELQKTIKSDKNIMQGLSTAYEARRDISKSLVAGSPDCNFLNGQTATSLKVKNNCSSHDCEVPYLPLLKTKNLEKESTLTIDDQALVIANGKPQAEATFGRGSLEWSRPLKD